LGVTKKSESHNPLIAVRLRDLPRKGRERDHPPTLEEKMSSCQGIEEEKREEGKARW